MTYQVFVDGQEGTTGLRIHAYLAQRSDVTLLRIDPAQRKDATERARLLNAADVVFLCLPDAAAKEAVSLVTNPHTCIIDASTAHRTAPGWVLGLPELCAQQRAELRASKRITNPGCHASAFVLLIRPLIDAWRLPESAMISATSITGYSGGGKKMIESYQEGVRPGELDAPRPYALGLNHKHLPEMMAYTGLTRPPVFMPVVGPFLQGLTVSVPLDLSDWGGLTPLTIHQIFSERYAQERFVRVMPFADESIPTSGFFDVQACNGTNRVDLFVFARENSPQALLMARLDNLGKGASGAAVQSMNVHLGLDESLGLEA